MNSAPEPSTNPTMQFVRLAELSGEEVHDLLKLRFDVFILEQQSLYPEIDGRDVGAVHLIASDTKGAPCGTLRMLGMDDDGPVHIGRVAVRADQRGTGLGRAMMAAALDQIANAAPGRPVRLGAQTYLEGFYASFGFRPTSGVYDDGGIPHVDMVRP